MNEKMKKDLEHALDYLHVVYDSLGLCESLPEPKKCYELGLEFIREILATLTNVADDLEIEIGGMEK